MTTQISRLVIEIDSRNALRNAQAIGRELENIDRNGIHASRSMDSVSVATRQLAGHMAGLLTVGAAVAKMDAYTGMQNRLKLVTESQEQLNLAMSDTFVIAQKSYQSWDSVIQVYQRFSDNAKTLKIDMAKTAELTETVSKAVAISGASTQAAEAALTQFGQALASGTLRGEELNSILEQTPALAKAIAQGMGITVGQLRSVAAEGKITGEVLVDALTKSKKSVDELFAKTDVTIGQSLQLLSNEVTKFTGEAGKASGAATTLASGIQVLANNLDAIAGIAMVGGAALLTKTILTQTVAIRGSISATLERRAADTAAIQSQVQLAAIEVQRTRQVAALALTEINLARQELNSATTRQARAAATMRLTQAEIAHNIAVKQSTAAVATQTAAENALNASRSRGAMLLGLVGGPIGAITIGVAGLTAGYMYLQKRTAEANAKLEEQGKVAEKTKEELLALKGVQLDVAKDDLAASFEDQNDKLNKLNLSFNGFIRTVKNANVGNKEVREISDQVHKGLMSQADAIERLNKLKLLTPEQKSQGLDLIKSYEEARVKAQQNADAQKTLGQQVTLSGNAASNAVGKVNDNTNAMYNNADAANAAADAQSKYISNLQKGAAQTIMTNKLIAKGWEIERAKMASQAAFENGGKVSAKDIQIIDMNIAANKKLQASEDAIANAKRGSSKASRAALSQQKKDAKEADRLAENQAKSRIDIDYRYLDEFKKFRADYLREVEEINKANFGSETSSMLKKAEEKYLFEEEMYLRQVTEEINAHKWSENQKLKYFYETQRIIVSESGKYNDEIKSLKLNALKEQEAHELGLIKLAKEQRIFQMREALLSETEAMQERYRLEREQILLNSNIDKEEKQRQIDLSKAAQQEENRRRLNNAVQQWGQTQADMNGTGDQFSLEQERFDRYDQSQALFDAEMAMAGENYALKEQAYQSHHDRMAEIEQNYRMSSIQLQMGYAGNIVDSIASMMKSMGGEQSKGYRVMYAASRMFTIANATLALIENVSNASKVGFPLNIPLIAGAFAQGATIASMLSDAPQGFATGGLIRGPGTETSDSIPIMASDKEFMVRAAAVKSIGVDNLNYINEYGELPKDTYRVGSGTVDAIKSNRMAGEVIVQPQININVPPGYTAKQSLGADGTVDIDVVRQEIAGTFNRIRKSNSTESRILQETFGLSPSR
ncbi:MULTISPECIES: tape measure protein [unclassified Acinetobacter]|uniref:tape measure protein n=1 Tax=unclassified Acinetobacter TaxID=196816 RepID=UPI0015D44812|nr:MULTISPECIES: tape measure protein [unclassified Acinetobacter]